MKFDDVAWQARVRGYKLWKAFDLWRSGYPYPKTGFILRAHHSTTYHRFTTLKAASEWLEGVK